MSPLVLVADNDRASVELARYLLEFAHFEVVCAGDGREALSLAAAHRPDAILLDLDLPVLDGCELRDRLAAEPALSEIPIVVMSVYEISDYCADHSPADFAGYLQKPIEPSALADQVRAAIRRK